MRIKNARTQKGISQAKLGEAMKVGQSTVQSWEAGKNEPTLDVIRKIALATDVDPAWLAFAIKPSAEEPDTERVYEKDVRGGMGAGGVAAFAESVSDEFGNITSGDPVTGVWRLPTDYLRRELRASPERVNIIEVQGDSMEPTLKSGDRIMIDTGQRLPSPPGIFALWDGIAVIVKRLEFLQRSDPPSVRVISDNNIHKPYEMTADEINIIGRVVWFARKM